MNCHDYERSTSRNPPGLDGQQAQHQDQRSSEFDLNQFQWILSPEAETQDQIEFLRSVSPDRVSGLALAKMAYIMRTLSVPLQHKFLNLTEISELRLPSAGNAGLHQLASLSVATTGIPIAMQSSLDYSAGRQRGDFFAALGIARSIHYAQAKQLLDRTQFTALHAPLYHSAIPTLSKARRTEAISARATTFDILETLINPASPLRQVLLIDTITLLKPIAIALRLLGVTHAMVCFLEEDEASRISRTELLYLDHHRIMHKTIRPEVYGLCCASLNSIRGHSKQQLLALTQTLLASEITDARQHTIAWIAALGIYVGMSGMTSLERALAAALDAIKSGRALQRFERFKSLMLAGGGHECSISPARTKPA